MCRTIFAVIIGLLVGAMFNGALVCLNLFLYPPPEGFDWDNTELVATYFESLPTMAFIVVLIAHLGQAGIGGYVAARLSKNRVMLVALLVGCISLVGGIMNAMSILLPTWVMIEMPLYLVVAAWAGVLELKRRAKHAS